MTTRRASVNDDNATEYASNGDLLLVRADWAQASAMVQYSTDGGESWQVSGHQVADARHSRDRAWAMVEGWLEHQA